MWHVLRLRHRINVPRRLVQSLLREVDPRGVERRKSRCLQRRTYVSPGPNFCWHMDGYDKLKPYGFSIHGCIDGFSRRILWLEVQRSNKNPRCVASYFCSYFSNKRSSYYVIECLSPWVVQCSDCVRNIYRLYFGVSILHDGRLDETLPRRR